MTRLKKSLEQHHTTVDKGRVMDEALLDVKEAGSSLFLDEQKTIVCPFCLDDWKAQGNPTLWKPYSSMSITRAPAGILYICHRATCSRGNKGGIVSDTLTKANRTAKKNTFTAKHCEHSMSFVPEEVLSNYLAKYYINKQTALRQEFRYLPTERRIYMPTFDRRGYTIGGTAKTLVKGLKPKTIQYRHNDVPMIHFPKGQDSFTDGPLILVEDTLSAVRLVVAGYRAAALLGTHITDDMLRALANDERDIILMLDGDASQKAIQYKRQFSIFFGNFSVVLLSNLPDAKELTERQLEDLLC